MVKLEDSAPAKLTGRTTSSSMATIQRTGRTKYSRYAAQRQERGHLMTVMKPASTSGSRSATGVAGMFLVANTYSVPLTSRRSRFSGERPLPRAKPMAALVGLPSASKAILAAGPLYSSTSASVASATPYAMTIRRRGLEWISMES